MSDIEVLLLTLLYLYYLYFIFRRYAFLQHKPPLYQLSYAHSCRSRIWTDISFLMREVCYQVHAILQSGYRDSNPGPLAPKASALTKLSHTPKYKTLIITDLQSVVLLRQINCCLGVFKYWQLELNQWPLLYQNSALTYWAMPVKWFWENFLIAV